MPVNYIVHTANSGNDVLGPKACDKYKNMFEPKGPEALDIVAIPCQELLRDKAIEQLQDKVGDDFNVVASDLRTTNTKPEELSISENAAWAVGKGKEAMPLN